jgi:hypothetical protein
VVSPNRKQVINLEPEFIKKRDGYHKQDCENAAVKRWLKKNPQKKYGHLGFPQEFIRPAARGAGMGGLTLTFWC